MQKKEDLANWAPKRQAIQALSSSNDEEGPSIWDFIYLLVYFRNCISRLPSEGSVKALL